MEHTNLTQSRKMPLWMMAVAFTGFWVAALAAMAMRSVSELSGAALLQQVMYTLVSSVLLAGVATYAVAAWFSYQEKPAVWKAPLIAGCISLLLFVTAYVFMGVWPIGGKSVMVVDMHHQYAPLLNELRDMFRSGGNFTYNFNIGLGGNFIPLFAYYLASPLNLLLLFFPERLLTEGILVITLLKGAATAAAFTACAQYVTRNRGAAPIVFGVLYSLSGYMLAYSWNIMWLDVVALLPVVVLAMEYMLKKGRMVPYILTLALALFVNYYIGFMLCVFLVLYMVVWVLRQSRPMSSVLLGGGRFALASLLAGGVAAALLIPTALSLGRTSAAGEEFRDFAANFPLFDLLGRMFYGASPTIRSGNLPNLYCGVPAVLLLPIYLTHKGIPLRKRLCYGGLLAVLLVSCTINQFDLLWHGMHSPNDLPYRFSFLVCFVLLLIGAQVMTAPTVFSSKAVGLSLAGCAVYLVLWERLDSESAPEATLLYMNLLLLAVYGAVLLLGAIRRTPREMTARLLLLAVCAELALGAGQTLKMVDSNEYYTLHDNYVDNDSTAAIGQAVQEAQRLGREELGEDFFRLEYLPRSTCMDTALHHYSGLTTFASSNPYLTTLLMGELGYAINGVNSYLYHSFVPAVDSLFGIRYVILSANLNSHSQLRKVGQVSVGEETRYIYRNELALPLGYMATDAVREYTGDKYAPFDSQEELYNALTGEWDTLYHPLELEATTDGASVSGTSSIYLSGTGVNEEFEAMVEEPGQYFAFVDCRAAEDITVVAYTTTGQTQNSWGVTNHEPYIIDMGTLTTGQTVEVWLNSDSGATGNVYIVRLDTELMTQRLRQLKQGGMTVTAMTDTHIEGTVNAAQDGALVMTIPYDKGWTVTVDGKPAETFPLAEDEEREDGALLCVTVPAGAHTLTFDYRAPGQMLGILVSLVSLLAVGLLWGIPYARRRKAKAAPVAAEPDEPVQPVEETEAVELPDTLEELLAEDPAPETPAAAEPTPEAPAAEAAEPLEPTE